MKEKLQVLFAAFEAVPFMKTGGLGDVAGSLPKALLAKGVDVRVIIPKFKTIPEEYKSKFTHVTDFYLPLGWRNAYCGIEQLVHDGVTYYFVDNESYFYRDNAYGYFDDGERIAYFSKAIVECIQYLPDFKCDIIHCNDWHTALAPVFLREFYRGIDIYDNIKTVFTVHNLKFQGQFTDMILGDILGLAHIAPAADQLRCDSTSINYMKGALCYSDLLSTVSPSYAHEIQEPFFGEHMNDIFSRRNNVLYGILNGINTDFYSPEKDTLIEKNFAKNDMAGKAECKKALQNELGFEENPDIPIITMIGRLTEQKGMDLLTNVFDELLNQPVQIAILGTGDWQYEETVRYFAGKYPGKLAALTMFDEALSHRLYAGADMLLMPSLFEPCGLSQMIAMHYGTLPIVREVGGLKDSVKPYNQYTGEGTGFSFANYNAHEMLYTIKDAITLYYDNKEAWKKLQEQAMSEDFSWNNAAERYIEMYERLHPEIPVVVEEVEEKEVAKEKPVKETEAEITGVHNTDIEKEAAKEEADKKEVAEAAGVEAAGVEAAGVEVAGAEKVTAKKEETEKETVKKATTKKTAAKKAATRKASTSKTTAAKAVSEAKETEAKKTETEPVEAKQTKANKTTRKSAAKKSETASTATKQTKARSTRAKSTQAKKTDTVSADDKDE